MNLACSKNVPSLYNQLQRELVVSLHDGDTKQSKNKLLGFQKAKMYVTSEYLILRFILFVVWKMKECISLTGSWFHENTRWFTWQEFAKSSESRREVWMNSSTVLVQERYYKCLYLCTQKMKDSSLLERRAVAAACTMLCLLSRLDFCFSQAKQET